MSLSHTFSPVQKYSYEEQLRPSCDWLSLDRCSPIRTVSLRFEEQRSTETMFQHLKRALANQHPASEGPPAANQNPARPSQMSMTDGAVKGSVSPAIQRCVSHITTYGESGSGVHFLLPQAANRKWTRELSGQNLDYSGPAVEPEAEPMGSMYRSVPHV